MPFPDIQLHYTVMKIWILYCIFENCVVLSDVVNTTSTGISLTEQAPNFITIRTSSTSPSSLHVTTTAKVLGFSEDIKETVPPEVRVTRYLNSIENEFQRYVVEKQLTYCPYTNLCNFETGNTPGTMKKSCCSDCSCDAQKCIKDRNCCPDAFPWNGFEGHQQSGHSNMSIEGMNVSYSNNYGNVINSSQPDERITDFLSSSDSRNNERYGYTGMSCVPNYLLPKKQLTEKEFLMVASCPQDSELDLRNNCSRKYTKQLNSLKDILPVINTFSFTAYRNVYCALCNAERENILEYWNPMLSCKSLHSAIAVNPSDAIEQVFSSSCYLEYEVPTYLKTKVKKCEATYDSCNRTGLWEHYNKSIEEACFSYRSAILVPPFKLTFRNIFCAMCNSVIPQTTDCKFESWGIQANPYSFSGLLKLELPQEVRADELDECGIYQRRFSFSNECEDLHCPEGTILRNNRCVPTYNYLSGIFYYSIFVRLRPLQSMTVEEIFKNASEIVDEIDRYINISNIGTCNLNNVVSEHALIVKTDASVDVLIANEMVYESNVRFVDVKVLLLCDGRQKPTSVGDTIVGIHNTNISMVTEAGHYNFTLYIIDFRKSLFQIDWDFHDITDMYDSRLFNDTEDPDGLRLSELFHRYIFEDQDGHVCIPYLFSEFDVYLFSFQMRPLNVLQFTSCPKITIKRSEIPWKETEDGINIGDVDFPSNMFYFEDNDKVSVCIDFASTLKHKLTLEKDPGIRPGDLVSIICLSLSLIALVFSLITFCILKPLRANIPGKNNLSFICFLMLAQLTLIISSYGRFESHSIVCKAFGVAVHFSWLLVIFWMNVCTFHMFRVLTRLQVMSHDSGWKSLLPYYLYTLVMALVFVALNITWSSIETGKLGYGDGGSCYISSQVRIIYTFALPSLVVVISNIAMFVSVIYKLRLSSTADRYVEVNRNYLIIFIKLSTLTGMTWIFGFLFVWTDIIVFSYVFISLNASQGVFVMLAFVCNEKTLAMSKTMLESKLESMPSSNTNSQQTGKTKTSHIEMCEIQFPSRP